MTGSLIVGAYDVLDGTTPGVLSTRDFGTSVPNTTTVARVLLDGDVVSGVHSGNRSVSLTIWIDTGTRSGDAQVQADLFAVVDQSQWQMTWTPEPGMSPVVFDCWRGSLTPTWDTVREAGGRLVVLAFPASPFLRDATPTVLAPPATMPAPVVLDALTNTTGLSTLPATTVLVDVAQVGANGYGEYAFLDPTVAGDAVAAVVAVDSTTSPTGSGGSVMVTTPLIPASTPTSYGYLQLATPHRFAPFTVTRSLAATTDLSATDRVSWSAKLESPTALSVRNPAAGLDPTLIGIDPSMRDGSQLAGEITSGTWTLTLFDTSGYRSTWVVPSPPSDQWSSVSAQISVPANTADANFDITHVASYRLRCYIIDGALTTTTLPTPELFPTAKQSGAGVNLVNCTTSSVPWLDAGVVYGRTYAVPMFPTGTGGTMEISRPDTVPVTAGQVYSGRGYVRSQDLGEATLSYPGSAVELQYAAMTFQAGVEWLNGSGAVISTSWAAAGTPLARVYGAPAAQLVTVGAEIWRAAESTVPNVTAPAGAVSARIRYRATGAVNPTTPIWTMAPRLVAGATAWRFPYATAPGGTPPGYLNGAQTQPVAARMWLSGVTATARTTGVTFTSPYGFAEFDNVQGAARTPVSLAVRATAGTPSRLLLARCANPGPGYTPFLTSGTAVITSPVVSATDATALTGQNLNTPTTQQAFAASWTVPAVGFSGVYTALARVRMHNTVPLTGSSPTPVLSMMGTLTAAFQLSGDPTVATLAQTNPVTAWDTWQWVTMGAVPLPTRNVDPTNTTQTMTITASIPSYGSTSSAQFSLDMIVLIDQSGEVVFINGVSATRYWIDAPTTSAYTGTVYAGNNVSRSDALSCAPYQSGQAVINFDPGRNMLLYVLDQATAGTITLTYAARWPGERP